MGLLTDYAELEELGGGRYRQAIGLKQIAYPWQGNRRRITDLIGNTGDPSLPLGTDELCQFRVRDRLSGNAPVVHFGKGQSHVRFTPLATSNVNGLVVGNTILFPGAWPNAGLRLSIAGHILRKDIPLRAGHPTTFQFRLDAHQNFNLDTLSSAEFRILDPVLLGPAGQSIPLQWAKSVQGGKTVLSVTLPAGNYAGWVLDPTLTLQPDGTDGKDAYLRSDVPTRNYGVTALLAMGWFDAAIGPYRPILQFDITSIPTNATVLTSSLQLTRTASFGTQAYTYGAYKLLRAWIEGTGDDSVSGDGATWNTYDGSNNWGTAGCNNTSTDRSGTAEDAQQINYATDNSWSIPTMTQDWVTTPANNKGVIMLTTSAWVAQGLWQHAASDNATAGDRPKLVVEYTMPSGGYVPILSRRRL